LGAIWSEPPVTLTPAEEGTLLFSTNFPALTVVVPV
jgi:hypothetical protein